jgi:hypothetical protein
MPTPDDMLTAVSDSLATRTGRSLEQWLALVWSCGVDPLDQSAVRNWLRREHSVPQNSQWAIADAAAREAGWVRPTGCASPIRRRRPGCSRAAGPGRPRTRYRCGT